MDGTNETTETSSMVTDVMTNEKSNNIGLDIGETQPEKTNVRKNVEMESIYLSMRVKTRMCLNVKFNFGF